MARRVLLTALAIAAVLSLTGCFGAQRPDGPPSIRGVITSTEPQADGGNGGMRVVWAEDPIIGSRAEFDAADVRVSADATIVRAEPERPGAEEIAFSQLEVGDIVEVWFTGAVAESYPVQAEAEYVSVIGRYEGALPEPPGLTPEPAP